MMDLPARLIAPQRKRSALALIATCLTLVNLGFSSATCASYLDIKLPEAAKQAKAKQPAAGQPNANPAPAQSAPAQSAPAQSAPAQSAIDSPIAPQTPATTINNRTLDFSATQDVDVTSDMDVTSDKSLQSDLQEEQSAPNGIETSNDSSFRYPAPRASLQFGSADGQSIGVNRAALQRAASQANLSKPAGEETKIQKAMGESTLPTTGTLANDSPKPRQAVNLLDSDAVPKSLALAVTAAVATSEKTAESPVQPTSVAGARDVDLPKNATQKSATQKADEFAKQLWRYLLKNNYKHWSPGIGKPTDFYASASVQSGGTAMPSNRLGANQPTPHGALLKMYVNRKAASQPESPPLGSIIVLENYLADRSLASISVMYRTRGFNPSANDWYWINYNPDGSVTEAKVAGENNQRTFTTASATGGELAVTKAVKLMGRSNACIACHRQTGDADLAFFNNSNQILPSADRQIARQLALPNRIGSAAVTAVPGDTVQHIPARDGAMVRQASFNEEIESR